MDREKEYEYLNEKKMRLRDMQDNLVIATLTICVAVLGVSFTINNYRVGLLVFCISIPIQILINSRQDNIAKISAYIIVFLSDTELCYDKISSKIDKKYEFEYGKKFKELRKFSISIVGLIAVGAYVFSMVENDALLIRGEDTIFLLIAVLAELFLFIMNAEFLSYRIKIDNYIKIIEGIKGDN